MNRTGPRELGSVGAYAKEESSNSEDDATDGEVETERIATGT